jgi:transposase
MNRRHEITDEQWERIAQQLPAQKPRVGRPSRDHRQIVNGIVWILRTGAPWRDLPERYGKWMTVYSRFQPWRKAGIWEQVWAGLQQQAAQSGNVDWVIHLLDSSSIRVHQHAAGAKKARPTSKPWDEAEAD